MASLVKSGLDKMKKGFTLIELIVAIGIFVLLVSISTISFFSGYSNTNLGASTDVLQADLKTAQSNAMAGMGATGETVTGWGLKIVSPNTYIIFPGSIYDPSDIHNSSTTLPTGVTISSNFVNDTIVFNQISGEIIGHVTGQSTITLTALSGTKSLTLNKYGTTIGE